MKSSLWTFANVASTVCVSDDAVSSVQALNRTLLTITSLVRRFDFHSKAAKLKKISLASFKKRVPGKRFLILQNISISVAETSMTLLRNVQRMRVTQLPNFRGSSIRLSAARLLNPQHSSPTMTLNRIWQCEWDN